MNALLSAIGNTPLIELKMGGLIPSHTRLFAKLESCNPGGSIKDRPVARMLTKAKEQGCFEGGRRLLDSSSGNAGIAYAMIGAALNIPVTIVIPGNASRERLDRISAHGAEIITTDPIEGYDFALLEAKRLARENPEKYWYSDQYSNENNWRAHYESTGPEILAQLKKQTGQGPDAFVAGVGTGGTITGTSKRLKEAHPHLHVLSVIPELFPGIEGLKPLGHPGDIVPKILDHSLIDERMELTLDEAAEFSAKLAKEGLFVGPSSGAYVCAALRLAERGEYPIIVTILNDTGERYGSTGLWQLAQQQLDEIESVGQID
jgi:S-sulfo-L-cysteine synthase (O-acetyl-L-serine-dependent)